MRKKGSDPYTDALFTPLPPTPCIIYVCTYVHILVFFFVGFFLRKNSSKI